MTRCVGGKNSFNGHVTQNKPIRNVYLPKIEVFQKHEKPILRHIYGSERRPSVSSFTLHVDFRVIQTSWVYQALASWYTQRSRITPKSSWMEKQLTGASPQFWPISCEVRNSRYQSRKCTFSRISRFRKSHTRVQPWPGTAGTRSLVPTAVTHWRANWRRWWWRRLLSSELWDPFHWIYVCKLANGTK